MKKLLFYVEDNWVFGKIHRELIKALYPEVYCDLLDWHSVYTTDDLKRFSDKYDYIMSPLAGCTLLAETGAVDTAKLIGTVHGDQDIQSEIQRGKQGLIEKYAGYTVVSPVLQSVSLGLGVHRVPTHLRIGVFQRNYPRNMSMRLERMGYFSVGHRQDVGFDLKRGHLVRRAAEKSGVELFNKTDARYTVAETLYKNIHVVMSPSLTEGNPYPMLEAFACGIPFLGTPVGMTPTYLSQGGGAMLPYDEDRLVDSVAYYIGKWRSNSEVYRKVCEESYELGMKVDWKVVREEWINYIYSLK